ncbi:uncharacterized protein [Oryza sativa Japonica Group]|uniref:Os05g0242600 protein n=4 Tax=Oryza sativa TaxID=4530 RepID=A0A0P0WJS8_ORYSJ|nr:uncharacterized protein LOC4338197 [Oryza sativa Japonica Group]KAB8098665.1 hypothetical protein EE612_028105 [Oryza sativa]AAV24817.1 unknown protein [Oryza sativa Japonica Group]KAF2929813.1 hypothetical protein DAI22_05g085000 [Oryza sativa Japonica Group]BAF16921.1 Os05g0242600 [Oryza sativa Japonica Group]BAG98049.1 unnamed protein product [Oryza sativa Japonica Group]|eukprot:NP_001055007.1 Os05g0242600 [Oryza sativa Japonica Group]
MLPAMPSLAMLFAVLLLCVANTLAFSFLAVRIFRADGGPSKLTASSVRRSTKCILVLACVVEVAVLFASLRLAADRHALSGEVDHMRDQIETLQDDLKQYEQPFSALSDYLGLSVLELGSAVGRLRDKEEHLVKEYRDLKLEIEQIKSDIQSLRHEKEGRGYHKETLGGTSNQQKQENNEKTKQPAIDGIMKSLRAKATKLQQVKISFPWEKMKKAKNIFSMDFKLRP